MKRTTLSALAFLACLLAFNQARADVIIGSSNATATVNVQAGGGSTPYILGPESDISNSPGAVTLATKSLDTDFQDAHDAVPNYRGTSKGSGSANAYTSFAGWSLSGGGNASAHTFSNGDLAQSLANATSSFDIYFEVTGSSVNYDFSGTLSNDYESPDQIVLARISPAGGPLQIVNNVQPNLFSASGSLIVGTYHIYGNINANQVSGPGDLGPDDEFVSYFFSILFDSGTPVYEAPEPGAGLLLTVSLSLLAQRCRRNC